MKKIVIAVDGYAACGKSTLARMLAKKLNYIYIDSGAMYRAVTLYILENNINLAHTDALTTALKNINIHFAPNPNPNQLTNDTYLNNTNIEQTIRNKMVSDNVSHVAAIKEVRTFLVQQQQQIGINKGITMDGRDIGTVVFPNAELKLFLTASIDVRAKRRHAEALEKGLNMTIEEIKTNLSHRDHIDSTRIESPLTKAPDAIEIDNSYLSQAQQLTLALKYANNIIGNKNAV